MPNQVDVVIRSRNETSAGFRTATDDAKEYGKGLEGVGERADNAEARTLGLKDTVDGVATIMQGPGKQGIAAYLQGWADLASGIANFVVPALMSVATAEGRQAIATAVSTVGQKAAAAASKAWAAATWVLNAALRANPIGIIITLLVALAAGLYFAYKRSETFRNIVNGAFRSVLSVARAVAGFFQNTVGNMFSPLYNNARNVINTIISWLRGLYNFATGIGRSIGNAIGSVLPGFAHGGVVGAAATGATSSGLTMVGEHGPELLNLAPGTRVRSNPDTRSMLAGAGGAQQIILEVRSGGSRFDDMLVEVLRKAIRVQGGNVQVVLGQGA